MKNIIKILEPYSCVELSRVASLLHLDERIVSQRISRMILDKKLRGIIDQDSQTITLLEEDEIDVLFNYLIIFIFIFIYCVYMYENVCIY